MTDPYQKILGQREEIMSLEFMELDLREQISTLKKQKDGEVKNLQDLIKRGEYTSGNTIKDFVISCKGSLSEEDEIPYGSLESKLKNNYGEPVLIAKTYITSGFPQEGFPPRDLITHLDPGKGRKETLYFLGILTSQDIEFDIKNGDIILPTNKYAKRLVGKLSKDAWVIEEGDIKIKWGEIECFNNEFEREMPSAYYRDELSQQYPFENIKPLQMQVLLGEEIEGFFNIDGQVLPSYIETLEILKESFKNSRKD